MNWIPRNSSLLGGRQNPKSKQSQSTKDALQAYLGGLATHWFLLARESKNTWTPPSMSTSTKHDLKTKQHENQHHQRDLQETQAELQADNTSQLFEESSNNESLQAIPLHDLRKSPAYVLSTPKGEILTDPISRGPKTQRLSLSMVFYLGFLDG